MGCCTNEACLILNFLKIFIYFNAPLGTLSALLCLLHLSTLLCHRSQGRGGGNPFGGIYQLSYYSAVGSAWMAHRGLLLLPILFMVLFPSDTEGREHLLVSRGILTYLHMA